MTKGSTVKRALCSTDVVPSYEPPRWSPIQFVLVSKRLIEQMDRLFNPHAGQERDRRSQIGSHKTGRELTPTVPGGHAKGSNCAARKRASSQRPSLRRRARRPLVKIRSAAIAGHEWTLNRLIPEPRLEGGISGVRGMPESWTTDTPERKAA
jgi:hypothetical protein